MTSFWVKINENVLNKRKLHEHLDAILFPTMMTEGFGFTAAEGMACGRPVIWFEQPAIREATGGVGLPVPQGDVDAMRNAMVKLIDDEGLRLKLGESGLRYARQHLSWSRVWEQYQGILEEVSVGS